MVVFLPEQVVKQLLQMQRRPLGDQRAVAVHLLRGAQGGPCAGIVWEQLRVPLDLARRILSRDPRDEQPAVRLQQQLVDTAAAVVARLLRLLLLHFVEL